MLRILVNMTATASKKSKFLNPMPLCSEQKTTTEAIEADKTHIQQMGNLVENDHVINQVREC